MGGLTEDRPKCLLELGGRPLLEWQIGALEASGVTDVSIVTGWRKELLESRVATTFHNARWAQTNSVASLTCAALWLQQEPCIVSYSDIFFPAGAVSALSDTASAIAITYDPNWLALWSRRFDDPLSDAETFDVDAAGNVVEIGARASSLSQIKGQYMGLLRFAPDGWKAVTDHISTLPAGALDKLDMTSLLRALISRRIAIKAVAISGRWGEVDTQSDLVLYEADLSSGLLNYPP